MLFFYVKIWHSKWYKSFKNYLIKVISHLYYIFYFEVCAPTLFNLSLNLNINILKQFLYHL
jgi:hypothetical protein